MSVGAAETVQHYTQRQQQALTAAGWYRELQHYTDEVSARVETQQHEARLELARAYLTDLSPDAIARAEKLTGFRGFSRRNPLEAMAHEKHVLEHTIARLESDERYQQRDVLAGPDGTIQQKLIEHREMLEPWVTECKKYEDLEGFLELVHIGYDTPRFAESWWQASYWKHWRAGDRICEALGLDDFGDDVLPAYTKVATQRTFWQNEVTSLERQLDEIHALVQQHDEALARIPQLPQLYLQQCHAVLAEFLNAADYSLLEEWAEQEQPVSRAIVAGLRKCAGLNMKVQYLGELRNDGLARLANDLDARATKYARKRVKYSRPKYYGRWVSETELDHKFEAKYHKLEAQRDKLRALIYQIEQYDDYQRFDLANEPDLWWREISGSRPPRLMPRTYGWYERNPSARPARDTWRDESEEVQVAQAVAVAAASRELDDVVHLS